MSYIIIPVKAMTTTNKKPNLLDLLIVLSLILSISGYICARAEKIPLNKIIQGKENIAIEVLIPDVFSRLSNIFESAQESAITIRNRPYTKLKIIQTESKPKLIVVPTLSGSYKTINDPTRTSVKDYLITLSDIAIKTNDGYVIGGNKIKIGNQIELEGFNYRLNGKVTNIYPLKESAGK